jgi:hypothetical protein
METGSYKMSFAEYLKDPAPVASLSRSTIKSLVNECPRKAFHGHPRLNQNYKREEKTQFDIGSAAHDLFLGGENAVMVFDYADWRKKEALEAKESARSIGKIPLLKHQFEEVNKMVAAAHITLKTFEARGEKLNLNLADGDSELTYLWQEKETWLRIRPDWISKDKKIVLDYKTTSISAEPEAYIRTIVSNGLDIQEALYCRGIKAVDGTDPNFFFLSQEVYEPYLCSLIELDTMFMDMGDSKVRMGIKIWRECMKSGIWPGYSEKLYTVEAPAWALGNWEMKRSTLLCSDNNSTD